MDIHTCSADDCWSQSRPYLNARFDGGTPLVNLHPNKNLIVRRSHAVRNRYPISHIHSVIGLSELLKIAEVGTHNGSHRSHWRFLFGRRDFGNFINGTSNAIRLYKTTDQRENNKQKISSSRVEQKTVNCTLNADMIINLVKYFYVTT